MMDHRLRMSPVKQIAIAAVLSTGMLLGVTERAEAIPLSDLLGGGSISALDKDFTDWTLTLNGKPFDLTQIEVTALEDQLLNPGLLFTTDVLTENDGRSELQFIFVVTSNGAKIKDNSLALLGYEVLDDGNVQIGERVEDSAGNFLVFKSVFGGPNFEDLLDIRDFDPQQSLLITKSIVLDPGPASVVSITQFSQRFSQVPEPATLALLGLGIAGIGYRRHRNRSM